MNYSNHVLGSVRLITECLNIVLYKKSKLPERISLYNLGNYYNKYLSGPDSAIHTRLSRSSSAVPFQYKKSLEDGFDVIVYISPSSNSPLGYTEFVNTQGLSILLDIEIHITRKIESVQADYKLLGEPDYSENFSIDLKMENNLMDNNLEKDYTGNKLYNYVEISEILSKDYRNLYTTDAGRKTSDKKSIIYSPTWTLCSYGFWKLGINKNINIDPFSQSLDCYQVCYYNNNLVIASWKKGGRAYSMFSLTSKNSLGYPYVYHKATQNGISEILGKYYIDTEGNYRDIDLEINIEKKNETLYSDPYDNTAQVYDLPSFFSKSEAIKYVPEINNIYLDLNNYLKSYQLIIYRKIGSWFILKQRYNGNNDLFIAVSPVSILYMTQEDIDRAFFVNDQTIILKEEPKVDGENYYYVVYKTASTRLYTERARLVISGGVGTFEPYQDTGIYMCVLGTDNDESHYLEYYDSNLVDIVFSYENIENTILNRYRRNIYPNSYGIPELIGAFCGVIFYKINNIINYL